MTTWTNRPSTGCARSSSSERARWARRSRCCARSPATGRPRTTSSRPPSTAGSTSCGRGLDRDVAKGRRARPDVDAAFERLTFTTDLDTAAGTADYVIEAAVEKLDVKRQIFARLDAVAPPRAILATNSSAIVSSQLADATGRPDRVCNMHFFNPALVMRCVEVVGGPQTSTATVETTIELTRRLGKEPVVLRQEIPGFVANRILGAVRDEAIFLLEEGVASVEAIDTACRTALGYPMGPFELMDLTGIDIGYHAKLARHATSNDPRDLPSRTVAALVERGELGRKTGKGFYTYDDQGRRHSRPDHETDT
jgi:3-hydroxybutyryl-CoA dehydrogenase